MDPQLSFSSRQPRNSPSRSSSTSSAIDLSGTSAGLAGRSVPTSPALGAPDNSVPGVRGARKRASWGKVDVEQDPLNNSNFQGQLATEPESLTSFHFPHETLQRPSMARQETYGSAYTLSDRAPSIFEDAFVSSAGNHYKTSQPGPSTSSLISRHLETPDGLREDDEAHLTQNISSISGHGWRSSEDPNELERSVGGASMGRKASGSGTVRYNQSPLKRSESKLRTLTRNVRRLSMRVVNFAGRGLEDHIRLQDAENEKEGGADTDVEEKRPPPTAAPSAPLPLRGRTLGFMGPKSRVRLAMYHFLLFPWTEPLILCLIIASTAVFVIQASTPLPELYEDYQNNPVRGFFHQWEDYALFAFFVLFTLEAFARMAVSGLIFDPEIPSSRFFTSLNLFYNPRGSSSDPVQTPGLSRQTSTRRSSFSIVRTLQRVRSQIRHPFALSHASGSSSFAPRTPSTPRRSRVEANPSLSGTPMLQKFGLEGVHQHFRNPSQPTYTSNLLKSDKPGSVELPFKLSIERGREVTRRNQPYLRHSWNRVDFTAIIGFWMTFALSTTGLEYGKSHIGIFRALSVLRSARLLAITSGTTTIMRSLKTAMPLLVNVAYFVVFAISLFSIIGLETFKGSFRRTCYVIPQLGEVEISLSGQFCGGYIDPDTLSAVPFQKPDGSPSGSRRPKGFICPLGQVCKEGENPNSGTENFDTFYYALLQVVILGSANGWTPVMYNAINAEYFVSCFFFIIAVLVLNFWLINLFVAVITNTFAAIRGDTKKSAFGAAPLGPIVEEEDGGGAPGTRRNIIKEIYTSIRWCWVALALASLVLQATRTVNMSDFHQEVLDKGELVLTIAFDVEIVIRFVAEFPDWRGFFFRANNILDLVIAIISSIIQIPVIHDSRTYPYLTIFQLMRFYRVILEIPRMRPLLLAVFGNLYGLWSMSIFLILINLLSALVSMQMLRPDISADETITFLNLFNAFLGVYQVFSSENWSDVLFGAIEPELPLGQAVIVAIYVSAWMYFANFIVLQMFIAVINENFDVVEEAKRSKQATTFWAAQQHQESNMRWTRYLNPYRWMKANPKAIAVENLPSNLVLPVQQALVEDDTTSVRTRSRARITDAGLRAYPSRTLDLLQRLFSGSNNGYRDIPLVDMKATQRDSLVPIENEKEDRLERIREQLAMVRSDVAPTQDIYESMHERRALKADFIRDHPSYDKTFWIFSQRSQIRQACQFLVQPANGERIFGQPPNALASTTFSVVILAVVIAGIVVESVATPSYRREYYDDNGFIRGAWFDVAESAFTLTLLIEFFIKIVADGLFFTPNAYIRSIWNILDLMVLMGIFINVTTAIVFIGGLSRFTRSLKALRALRLITLLDKMRSTFSDLIISGAGGIMDAALLAILYMIPYAVWGLNIFAGFLNECNDGDVEGLATCVNEYIAGPMEDKFTFLVPRVWDNPAPSTKFSFDNFRSSLLILFEIVSLEGWTDVMGIATSATGPELQPQNNASEVNALFFLLYHLMGGVVILTLFVSIIIGNFKNKTGSALQTQPQKEWMDLQKLLRAQKPSRRPKTRPKWGLRSWCFDRAVQKHGWWARSMTFIFFIHFITLMTQSFEIGQAGENIQAGLFLLFSAAYALDVIVRFFGLGWYSFRSNGWNLFDTVVAAGSLSTTIITFVKGDVGYYTSQLQKLFLVAMGFKLVQRIDILNKLFKTARASLLTIASLLGLWLILFVFFSIMFVEVFGLTKWGSGETSVINFSTIGSALVMLSFMSVGEGWNQYMHDYALVYPHCTNSSDSDKDSDCGSIGWAFSLFIAWNLLSMYIFVNMFTGVVVDNFSFVFQTTSSSKSITREEMRAFKKVWALYANPRTGFLERENLVKFLGRLGGVFEVRIYPIELSIPNIRAEAQMDEDADLSDKHIMHIRDDSIDMRKLKRILGSIDYAAVRQRRNRYLRIYHEAQISCPVGRGISFTEMLLLLAHHKLIVEQEALSLKELVVRTEVNRHVIDEVRLDRVQSLLEAVSLRRRYLRERIQTHQAEHSDIPEIVVESLPPTPPPVPLSTRDIASPVRQDSGDSLSSSPRNSMNLASISPIDTSSTALRRSRRTSDMSMLSADMTDYTPRHSLVMDGDHENIVSSMQNSLWGEMMKQAADEDNSLSHTS